MLDPSIELAVILVVPGKTAVTRPVESTVATNGLLDVHWTVLFAALEGVTVAVKLSVEPTFKVEFCWFNVIPVTKL